MNTDAYKMKIALNDMKELYQETADNLYFPKKFRKMDFKRFVEVERAKYLAGLSKDIEYLSYQIRQMEKVTNVRRVKPV